MHKLVFKAIEEKDFSKYHNFVADNSISFTQAPFYGNWHKESGRKVYIFSVEENRVPLAYMQIIEVPTIFRQKYFYCPYGPIIEKNRIKELIPFLKTKLKDFSKRNGGIFFRLDFTPKLEDNTKIINANFTKSPKYTHEGVVFQPRDEWILNIEKNEEELLNNIHKKNRYCIRRAEEQGTEVEIITENFIKHFDAFYDLMKTTSERNGFGIHIKSYYKYVFQSLEKNKNGFLVLAKIKGEVVNIFILLNFANTTNYVFGGSSNSYRNIPSAHLAQWHSILYAKKIGSKFFNFGGISTPKNKIKNWEDITRYKTRFGGEILEHSDFYDIVANPLMYKFFIFKKKLDK